RPVSDRAAVFLHLYLFRPWNQPISSKGGDCICPYQTDCSCLLELQNRVQVPKVIDSAGAAEDSEFDQHGDAANVCFTVVAEESCAGFECAAGGEEVVDEDDSAAGADGIDVDFE